jgi:hypothetical protein
MSMIAEQYLELWEQGLRSVGHVKGCKKVIERNERKIVNEEEMNTLLTESNEKSLQTMTSTYSITEDNPIQTGRQSSTNLNNIRSSMSLESV